jgi:hypothetical protein
MSHMVEYAVYAEDVDRKKVERYWNEVAASDSDYGVGGLDHSILWLDDDPLPSREEAEERLEYAPTSCAAVRFLGQQDTKHLTSSKLEELNVALVKAKCAYETQLEFDYCSTRTSAFIGCPACKSKLARQHLHGNFCPVCGADLRPSSKQAALAAAKTKVEDLKSQINQEKADLARHAGREVMWLVNVTWQY